MKNFVLLLFIVVLSAATGAFVAHKSPAPANGAARETAYQRVMRTGILRCAYTPYSVGLIKDPNTGKLSGIYYDVITGLADHLSLKVDWTEEVGWGNQIEGLEAKRYDLICSPVSLNAGRARAADFSVPLFYSPVHIWARKDDTKISDDLKALNSGDVRVSTLDGEQTTTFAKEFFPAAQRVSLPQTAPFSDLLLQVTTGKADAAMAEPVAAHEFMKNNPGSLRQVTADNKPLLVVPNIILLPRDEFAFKEMIDNGLREMFNARAIDRIIDKWEPYPGSYIRETGRR